MTDAGVAPPRTLGVVGAGVMGAGIAQLGCLAGMRTLLCDVSPAALTAGRDRIARDLERGAERGRWSAERAANALGLLEPVDAIGLLEPAELVIEAVAEDLEVKVSAIAELRGDPVVATNTSSLSITAIAARAPRPTRVVGMHFFNPPPLMRLVELIAGADTSPDALALARATALAMDRTPIGVRDAIGFVVNRGARPFYTEALQLLEERVATAAQIDRICRLGGGFRMGPFELMDLVGTDTGLAVADMFTARSLGEPRWKPSPSQRRLVAAGRLGRKSERGWHDYRSGPHREPDPEAPRGGEGHGRVLAVLGGGTTADGLRTRAVAHGFAVVDQVPTAPPLLTVVTDPTLVSTVPLDLPTALCCATRSLAAARRPGAVGLHLLPPVEHATLLELTSLPTSDPEAVTVAETVGRALGLHVEWIDDAPALVLGRIVAQLVNEACFATGEGVATADDLDTGLTLGLNHPFGPIAWGERIGWDEVLARVDGLWHDRHDHRYRAAPLLRRAALTGMSVRALDRNRYPEKSILRS